MAENDNIDIRVPGRDNWIGFHMNDISIPKEMRITSEMEAGSEYNWKASRKRLLRLNAVLLA